MHTAEKLMYGIGLFAFFLIHIQRKGIASQLEEMHNSAVLFFFFPVVTASSQAAVGFFSSSAVFLP